MLLILRSLSPTNPTKLLLGGRLALEAVTVLSRALTQIECGELAIVSFGDEVKRASTRCV